jgi:hypothetical protein
MCVLYEVWSKLGEPDEHCIHTTFSYFDAIKQSKQAAEKYENVEVYVFDDGVMWKGDSNNVSI